MAEKLKHKCGFTFRKGDVLSIRGQNLTVQEFFRCENSATCSNARHKRCTGYAFRDTFGHRWHDISGDFSIVWKEQ